MICAYLDNTLFCYKLEDLCYLNEQMPIEVSRCSASKAMFTVTVALVVKRFQLTLLNIVAAPCKRHSTTHHNDRSDGYRKRPPGDPNSVPPSVL